MTSVCAFVLTRNRKVLLVECLRALVQQSTPVQRIFVLDNASDDGTQELLHVEGLLEHPRIDYVRQERNTGGAAGFAQGIGLGAQADTDWLWLMDDDAEPRPDALERLLASAPAREPRTAALCCAVVHPDGSVDLQHRCRLARFITPLPREAYRSGYARVDCASFVGLLLRGDIVRTVDLPLTQFFMGYDDAEYSLRVGEKGDIRLVPESQVVHKIVIGGGTVTARGRMWNRLLGQQYAAVPWQSFWKDLYRVRNFMWLRQRHGGLRSWEFTLLTAGYLLKSLMYDPQPWRRLPWLVRFARKGRRGDFAAPAPEQWIAFASRVGR